MGCWATDSFGNDSAADWLWGLKDQKDLSSVHDAISQVLRADGYLASYYATEALAAIEVVAVALGRPTPDAQANDELMTWVAQVRPTPGATLISDAIRAIDRVLSPESELRELWEETDDFSNWQANVAVLRAQLQA